ncbi:MAG TPA: AAA family ATPase [Ruminococcus sp.]|nr:AAA family ATPase [Ruminococcus sp.]
MNFSEETSNIIYQAIEYSHEKGYEYVTPEILLLMILDNGIFSEAFENCGGSTEMLRDYLKEYAEEYIDRADTEKPEFSDGVNALLNIAARSAYNSGSKEVCLRHLIHGLWQLDDCYAVYFIEKQGISEADLLQEMAVTEEVLSEIGEKSKSEDSDDAQSGWKLYAPCLNETLTDVNPLIGRQAELDRTIQILCRKDKNNPLHIGEPGVGKTALTYGLVQLIRKGDIPEPLKDAKVFALDLGGMLAGTQYRGDFEKRFKKVLAEIGKEQSPIIYIDEIHNLSGAGAVGEGSFDASNMLKPYLSDGKIRFIGATTFEEYKKYFEKNKSLVRRFQNVEIKEPDEEETIKILEGLKSKYEKFHKVRYSRGVLEYAVHMSAKYINERCLPDKAIDLIDEAGAYRKLHPSEKKTNTVDKAVINEVLTTICRVPVETVSTDDISGLAGLEKRLKKRIFGQDEAIDQVVNAVKFSKAGLIEENKPLASLLFVGPTGVGKTEIAKSLADELGVKLIRFDMSEYGEKHAVAKLIGSPAGYVGYEDGGLLTEAIRKTPSAVLLLDEIEKAHSDIYNILLQVMDYATLTDNQGRKADFRNVVVIMTSNAGADRIGKSTIGFQSSDLNASVISEAVKQTFQPEFRNRLNKIVVFNSMDDKMAQLIVDKKLSELAVQLSAKKILFNADKNARTLVQSKGISQEFGAREVDRVIRNEIKPLFVDEILFGSLKNGGSLTLSAADGSFTIKAAGKKGKNGGIQT